MTVFWSIKGSPYTENPRYRDIPLTVTLFGRPNTVTISGEACNVKICSTSGVLKQRNDVRQSRGPRLGTGNPLLDALLLSTASGAAGGATALVINGLKNGFTFP